jgi:hypothetical protein
MKLILAITIITLTSCAGVRYGVSYTHESEGVSRTVTVEREATK